MKLFLTIFFLWYNFLTSFCQTEQYTFLQYTAKEGLSQNSANCIIQSNEGFLWFTNQRGLNRFDGINFINIQPSSINSSIKSDKIFHLQITKNDEIVLGTDYGIWLYDRFNNKFYTPQTKYKNFNIPSSVNTRFLYQDTKNNMWIATASHGLFKYDFKSHSLQKIQLIDQQDLNSINYIVENKNGEIWICTDNNIYKGIQNSFETIIIKSTTNKLFNKYRNIVFAKNKIWVSTANEGICELMLTKSSNYFLNPIQKSFIGKSFPTDVSKVLYDGLDNIWVGTRRNGIYLLDIKTNKCYSLLDDKLVNNFDLLKPNFIMSLYKTKANEIAIGSSSHGIYLIKKASSGINLYKNESTSSFSPDNVCLSLYVHNNENIYAGMLYSGLLHYNTSNNKYTYYTVPQTISKNGLVNNMYTIVQIRENLWIASWGGLLSFNLNSKNFQYYPNSTNEKENHLWSLGIIDSGNLIIGSETGISTFNINSKRFTKLMLKEKNNLENEPIARYFNRLSNTDFLISSTNESAFYYNHLTNKVTPIPNLKNISITSRHTCIDKDFVWVATDAGLVQLNKKNNGILKTWTKKDGLYDDFIYAVKLDSSNSIWGSTNSGLFKLNYKQKYIESFRSENNLQDLEFNTACSYSLNNVLYFGGIKGFNKINPNKVGLEKDSSLVTPILTAIEIMNVPYCDVLTVPYVKEIKLKHNENFVGIGYLSPNFFKRNIIYSYKMVGQSNKWVLRGSRKFINFTDLKPGKYVFWVRAETEDKTIINETQLLTITIIPPWWATSWFRFIAIIFLLSVLILAYKRRIVIIQRRANEDKEKLQMELTLRNAQMNPHFIYNCLNSIKELVLFKRNNEASNYISKFALVMKETINNSKKQFISLEQSIQHLKDYIEMEKLRFNGFESEINIDERIIPSQYYLPPMLLQPLVENAIWHGVKTSKDNQKINIQIFLNENEDLICIIEDFGKGFTYTASDAHGKNLNKNSMAVSNIFDRLAILNSASNYKITLEIINKNTLTTQNTTGTLVTFTFPKGSLAIDDF